MGRWVGKGGGGEVTDEYKALLYPERKEEKRQAEAPGRGGKGTARCLSSPTEGWGSLKLKLAP